MNRHPYQRNHKHASTASVDPTSLKASLEAPHEPRAALRGDQGFIYPDEPPCRIERPEPCDIPARYMSASAERGRKAR